jgi:hypothetical protein
MDERARPRAGLLASQAAARAFIFKFTNRGLAAAKSQAEAPNFTSPRLHGSCFRGQLHLRSRGHPPWFVSVGNQRRALPAWCVPFRASPRARRDACFCFTLGGGRTGR